MRWLAVAVGLLLVVGGLAWAAGAAEILREWLTPARATLYFRCPDAPPAFALAVSWEGGATSGSFPALCSGGLVLEGYPIDTPVALTLTLDAAEALPLTLPPDAMESDPAGRVSLLRLTLDPPALVPDRL
ncbi:MAG: hypothetical protein JXQ91_04795 [Vannielia sp.]|uniref:hypothetical protein n=1 Tax=Vannielia sp. TaxID=2813045 RepID=UPI003B8B3FD7